VLGPATLPVGPGDLAVNAGGSLVAVAGGYDGKVVVYRTGSGEPVGIVPGMPRPSDAPNVQDTAAVGFGPDRRLYVGSLAGPVRAVDPSSLAVTSSYDTPPRSTNNHLTVTRGGVLVGAGDANLVAIDTAAGAVEWSADIVIAGDPFPCPYFAVSELMGRVYCGDYYGTRERMRPRVGAS
jgi:hypothetical protein